MDQGRIGAPWNKAACRSRKGSAAARPALTAAFAFVLAAAMARVAGSSLRIGPLDGIDLSAALWVCGFGLLCWKIGPWLAGPKLAARTPSGPSRNR
ncbi:NnrS family protein [Mangrovicoccus ximenensis]|uniref:NnrS family protein n=1 Tax=Mangrovicoccus ximenensis TaxID=1911570 RepID=UPI001F3F0564|nr:NnrS family protein [Mangrovicoccus ximenensis]